ncbi:MAG: 50S ribosomal protein L25/general stress protein Ctc [Pseudomonadales bacterium RIFCSPLOWO2_12_60_38]|jgi:large subunit ribosomal protein L25|uniref:Large ribosomal subunit protein bL25 n=8 Tax=Pseudomonas TaxID=286 RepID=A0A109L381_PSEFL|nr:MULTISPECIES: 50S ribosomal protein L25/general stress protein Ctc [Pseudomonas]AFJ56722.1 ribosomal protein L25, Ctc-form [Pseudomonas fluorescens A506]ETK38777.1 50S ribosomal protein L25 [Pseudomonas fluorescens FH5]MDN5420567.1 50S ribosomal protein L25/general stress protein Ctc [Pseudomonadales bacterium]OHC34352.1 MAG: 50S ribosomal protein L25/general stress protein Ctc [Pseudomonadales bacterium RIFCSPLOWO2_12_60_38]OHC40909.1 MAG: 50S ribosomal protein L25/general stress protein C
MNEFTLNAQARTDLGKGASRRLRHAANIPAVVYGGNKPAESVTILAKEIAKLFENEAAYSHVIELNVDGAKQNVIVKAMQRHPSKQFIMHADFVRVVAGQKLTAIVPVHFVGEEAPVKKGGEISHVLNEIEVTCLPKDLPEFIEVDLSALEIGAIVHLSDLKAPKGVEFVALAHGDDKAVANVHAPRVAPEEAEEGAAE